MKKNKLQRPPSLFYFRGNTDVILFLLQKELKGGKVSQLCAPLGINDEFFYPNLGTLILSLMDLPYRTESIVNWYEKKLHKWSSKVDLNNHSDMAEITLDFYYFLKRNFKRRLKG
jgi:hypothetical protein